MTFEKYIKYKKKYLNLKTIAHNLKIQSDNNIVNSNEDDYINTLGSSPESEIFLKNNDLVGGGDSIKSDYNLPDKLSSSEENIKSHIGGSRKLKKKKNVFSDSDSDSEFNSDDSLSFSSSISDSDSSD